MARTFSIGTQAYRLCTRDERFSVAFPDVCKVQRFTDVERAAGFLRRVLRASYADRPRVLRGLRQLLSQYGATNVEHLDDDEVLRRTAQALVAGRLVVQRLTRIPLRARGPATPRPQRDLPPPAATPPASTEKETTWIRFRIVDDETDERLANVKLTLTLSDGSQQKATTNADGLVYITGLPDGACDIVEIDYEEPLEVRSVG
jgi:hypothetical protein